MGLAILFMQEDQCEAGQRDHHLIQITTAKSESSME